MKRVLIISTARKYDMQRQPLQDLVAFASDAVAKKDLDASVAIVALDELVHVLDGSNVSIRLAATDEDIALFDFVWLRGRFVPTMNDISLIAEYLDRKGVTFENHSYAHRAAYGKAAQMHVLAHLGLPYPKTVYASGTYATRAFRDNLDFPMIVKNNMGAHGDKNYLVHDEAELNTVLADNAETEFIAQEYIPNDADFRILLAGSKQLLIRRQGADDTHLNNTSQGATASLVMESDFPKEVLAEARAFSHALHYTMSGVDVMFDKNNGNHYFLEANSQPQIISGAFIAEKQQLLADYIIECLTA